MYAAQETSSKLSCSFPPHQSTDKRLTASPGRNHRLLPALAKNMPLVCFLYASRLKGKPTPSVFVRVLTLTNPPPSRGRLWSHPLRVCSGCGWRVLPQLIGGDSALWEGAQSSQSAQALPALPEGEPFGCLLWRRARAADFRPLRASAVTPKRCLYISP